MLQAPRVFRVSFFVRKEKPEIPVGFCSVGGYSFRRRVVRVCEKTPSAAALFFS